MKLKEYIEWLSFWVEDMDKEIIVEAMPYGAKTADLSISDDGSGAATLSHVEKGKN